MKFDYERGLEKLKSLVDKGVWYSYFNILALRLMDNLNDERLYGNSDKAERFKIIAELDRLTLQYGLEMIFSELCRDLEPSPHRGGSPLPMREQYQNDAFHEEHTQVNSDPSSSNQRLQSRLPQLELKGTGHHWAILVGISKYEDTHYYGQLEYCASDAKKMYHQLLLGGFEEECVHLLCDGERRLPTKENILATLQAVAGAAEPDDLLLFYFSGHGEVWDGNTYLIPYNARGVIQSDTGVSLARVKQIMEEANVRAKVIILDACHSGENLRSKGSKAMPDEFYNTVIAPAEGMVILSSCSKQQYSYEWREKQCGVFTYYLLEALQDEKNERRKHTTIDDVEKSYITIAEVNKHISLHVRHWASQRQLVQTPTLNCQVTGEIALVLYSEADSGSETAEADTLLSLPEITDENLPPQLASIHNYIEELSALIKKTHGLINSPRKVYEFQYHYIIRDISKIEKPSILHPDLFPQAQEQKIDELATELNYIDHTCTNLMAEISGLLDVQKKMHQSARRQSKSPEKEQKKRILNVLSLLQRRIESVSEVVSSLEVKKPPGQPVADEKETMPLDLNMLTPYLGDVWALRQGRVHQELSDKANDLGVSLKSGSELPVEDVLERAKRVPLHAIFLYTNEDVQVREYIYKYADDLSAMSGDLCDIYLSLGQLEDKERAYDHVRKLTVIKQSDMPEYQEIPGILFWDHYGEHAYVPFGKSTIHDELRYILRTIFGALQQQATITTINRARQVLAKEQNVGSMKGPGQQNGQGNGWNDFLVIALAFLIIVSGLIILVQFVNSIVLSIVLIAALLFFVLFMVWYLRSRNDLSESNFVKIIGRFFNALPLLREGRQKEDSTVQRDDNH